MRGTYTTVPIRRSRGGQKFFLHQGIRFLVKDGSVYRASFSVGEDYADFHSAAKVLPPPSPRPRRRLVASALTGSASVLASLRA